LISKVNLEISGDPKPINLLHSEFVDSPNAYFTVLIGSNGTFKSSILGEIAKKYREQKSNISINVHQKRHVDSRSIKVKSLDLFNERHKPSNLICISVSPFDKFPLQGSHLASWILSSPEKLGDIAAASKRFPYHYLGLKSSNGNGIRNSKDRIYSALLSGLSGQEKPKVEYAVKACFDLLKIEKTILLRFHRTEILEKNLKSEVSVEKVNSIMNTLLSVSTPVGENEYDLEIDGYAGDDKNYSQMLNLVFLEKNKSVSVEYIFIRKSGSNQYYDLLTSSSGELSLLLYCFGMCNVIDDNSVILIDEPEISLHPNWQIEFIKLMTELCRFNSRCHCIIATHSPHILSGLPPERSKTISLFKNSRNELVVNEDNPDTSGWSVEKILLDIFEVQTVRNSYFEADIRSLFLLIKSKENLIQHKGALDILERLSHYKLEEDDPLLPIVEQMRSRVHG
jgi:predicted ATPase